MNRTLASVFPYDENSLKFNLSGEIIVGLFIALFLIILFIIVGILARKADPKKPSKGILMLAEWAVEKLDNFVKGTMGPGFENFGGLLLGIIPFLFLSFTIGITGLPAPINNIATPLSMALVTFVLIHVTSIRYTKWKYFKRFIDPIPVFLPINLLSMWAPLLSLTLRMFGNAVSGWVLLGLVNWALEGVSASIFGVAADMAANSPSALAFVPIATPLLHAYFDLFSGFIQTLVFTYLTVLFIAQEKPEDAIVENTLPLRKEATK
jgi:F-type H+-transporting ATPase subunit a